MKAKIIIVEDHEPIRNELKILLSKYGYEIIVLDRFDTVVEDCLREDVDLILSRNHTIHRFCWQEFLQC